MKKLIIGTSILIGSLFFLWTALRIFGVIDFYRSPTPANSPTKERGSYLISSKFKEFKKRDFVFYEHSELGKADLFIHRVCDEEGDVIQITNGTLFVNNQNFDEGLDLKHAYSVSPEAFHRMLDENIIEEDQLFPLGPQLVHLQKSKIKKWMQAEKMPMTAPDG